MTTLVKIEDDAISVAEFLQSLKRSGQFEGLIEPLVWDGLSVQAAKNASVSNGSGMTAPPPPGMRPDSEYE